MNLVVRNGNQSDPLYWQCPKCGADPNVRCFVKVPGGELRLHHDYGTHPQRKRLALFFHYNPNHSYNDEVWKFATGSRD